MATVGSVLDNVVDVVGDVAKGTTKKLNSNGGISPTIYNFTGAVESIGRVIGGEKFTPAIRKTFGKYSADGKTLLTGKEAGWNVGKIAGSYIGASAAGRVLSGGGAYKDGRGNTNLIGVPFV